VLKGYGGSDTLVGVASGVDTAAYSGPAAQYLIKPNGPNFTVTKPDGTDQLISIKNVRFADKTVSLTQPASKDIAVTGTHAQYVIVDGPGGQALILTLHQFSSAHG